MITPIRLLLLILLLFNVGYLCYQKGYIEGQLNAYDSVKKVMEEVQMYEPSMAYKFDSIPNLNIPQ